MITQFAWPTTPVVNGTGLKIGIVIARNNLQSVGPMFSQAYELLTQAGVARENIYVISVPISHDLVSTVKRIVADKSYDAIICLGHITAETTWLHIPAEEAEIQGLQWVAFYAGVPILFCVTRDQAQDSKEVLERVTQSVETALKVARRVSA